MKKTLILVVDRDDDFGAKGGVETPVIGIEGCTAAATALGTADPEDSDTNALYAAMNIYRDMERDGEPEGSFEVALICGNQKVGYKSDRAVVEELNRVLDEVKPDRAILVGDGAEDEYIYPIVSSRVSIDSVRKVYVKQAPGVEGTFYIIQKTLSDPQKKERFLAPISIVIMVVCAIYMAVNYISSDGTEDFLVKSATVIIFFVVGFLLMLYSYSLDDRIRLAREQWSQRARTGSITLIFAIGAVALIVIGLILGYLSTSEYYTTRTLQRMLLFFSNALWPIVFGFVLFASGLLMDSYIKTRQLKIGFLASSINLIAIGVMMNGFFDLVGNYLELEPTDTDLIIVEIIGGFVIAIVGNVLQHLIKRAVDVGTAEASDEVQ